MTPYFNPATAESEQDHYLAIAAEIVQDLAPAPSPVPADYATRAARAERLLLNYLTSTRGGTLTAKGGIPGATGSKTFAARASVQSIVSSAMGGYYLGGADAFSLGVASSFPEPVA